MSPFRSQVFDNNVKVAHAALNTIHARLKLTLFNTADKIVSSENRFGSKINWCPLNKYVRYSLHCLDNVVE